MDPDRYAAFLRAVLESPEEDAPRLVLADALEEEGDPRGEFIRVQCELAKRHRPTRANGQPLKADSMVGMVHLGKGERLELQRYIRRTEALERRERQLFGGPDVGRFLTRAFDADITIITPDPTGPRRRGRPLAVVRRGFVETIECPCADWLAHGPAVVRAQPVTRATLSDKRPTPYSDGWRFLHGRQGCNAREFIPAAICRHWPRPWNGDRYQSYPSTAEAEVDLSVACLAWSRAALPAPAGAR